VPIAYSQGFTPHPRISYVGASPTGVASEAEYLELALQTKVDPADLRLALDAALSPGLDVLEAVEAGPGAALADRIDASLWRIELAAPTELVQAAVDQFLATEEVLVERMTKQGRRRFDARAAVVSINLGADQVTPDATDGQPCAILDLVVRQVTPSVRPDDVLAGLQVVADLKPSAPARMTRLAQGRLTGQGDIVDPLQAGDDGLSQASTAIGESSE
jgi:radical SAM-linked protein